MGRYDFRPSRVLQTVNQLLETKRITQPPPWYDALGDIPPGETLVRPVHRFTKAGANRKHRRPSRMFQPMPITYPEDQLRTTFFADHPWELARPRILVEETGNDSKEWDWSQIEQGNKRLDGESVIRRQQWLIAEAVKRHEQQEKIKEGLRAAVLIKHQEQEQAKLSQIARLRTEGSLSGAQLPPDLQPARAEVPAELQSREADMQLLQELAYDQARHEFYKLRLEEDVERQVAQEEARHVGAYFGPNQNEVAMPIEDKAWEEWQQWAMQDNEKFVQQNAAMYSGSAVEESEEANEDIPETPQDTQNLDAAAQAVLSSA